MCALHKPTSKLRWLQGLKYLLRWAIQEAQRFRWSSSKGKRG